MHSDNSTNDLCRRREKVLRDKETVRLRETYGDRITQGIGAGLGLDLCSADFSPATVAPFKVDWPKKIEEAKGLVLAYVSMERAVNVSDCIDGKAALKKGLVGVHGNSYLGLCAVDSLKLTKLVAAALAIEDSVVFYPDGVAGAIVIDCYPSNPGGAFSLLVQGDTLVNSLASCFREKL